MVGTLTTTVLVAAVAVPPVPLRLLVPPVALPPVLLPPALATLSSAAAPPLVLTSPLLERSSMAAVPPVFAAAAFPVPTDADTTGSITCLAEWTTMAANGTAGCSYVIKAALTYLSSSALPRTSASVIVCASYNYTALGNIHETTVGTFPSFGANDKLAVLQIASDQTNASDTGGSNVAFLGVKLRYLAKSLGGQSSE